MTDLDQRLIDLLDSTDLPSAPLEEDLARGRAHLRRRRTTIGAAVLGTAVVLTTGWALGAGGDGDAARTTAPIAADPSTAVRPAPTSGPAPTRTPPPLPATIGPLSGDVGKNLRVLRRWNDVLAEHLDPGREHLQEVTRMNWNVQGGTAYGSKYGWQDAGDPGLGMLQLSIAASADVDEISSPCTWEGIPCPEVPAPEGAERVRASQDSGRTMVVVERSDAQAVALTFDPLFGNNSLTPVSGAGPTTDDLVSAALDLRLTIR